MTTLPKEDAPRVPRPMASEADPAVVERPGPATAYTPSVLRPQAASGFSPGTVIDGRYRVIRFLNQGGNGVVHEVEHLRTGRRLAMKSLVDDASAARLEQEARATALMKNPHVVKATDMGPAAGVRGVTPYLVMELLEGQSLRDLLDEAGQLPLELTVNIALQVCECLAEAHERNVIHRDLKPDNLFLLKSPWPGQYDVMVLDFGVMKIAGEGPIPKGSLTRTGSTVGTPYYMSLEQLRNSSAVDARADIYSLGVVMYECLAGRKPFVADTIGDLVYALCSGPATPLSRLRPDLPADVCDAVMRALKMNREDRPPSMTEVGAALLPHGHPAFSLWLRAGESAPPASIAPLASLREAPPKTITPAPPTPDEDEGTTIAGVAVRHDEVADPKDGEGPETSPAPVMPRRERETPTEMYRGVSFSGDRDTPTRALPAPSFAELDAAMARSAASAAAVEVRMEPDNAPTFRMEPRFGASTERIQGQNARSVQSIARDAAVSVRVPDAPSMAGQRIDTALLEPPRFDAAPEPRMGGITGQYAAAVVPAVKPGWQQSLDRALAVVGGFIEGLVRKVRAQPPPVQYAVLGTIGLVVLLLLTLLFVIFFR